MSGLQRVEPTAAEMRRAVGFAVNVRLIVTSLSLYFVRLEAW